MRAGNCGMLEDFRFGSGFIQAQRGKLEACPLRYIYQSLTKLHGLAHSYVLALGVFPATLRGRVFPRRMPQDTGKDMCAAHGGSGRHARET